MAEIEPPEPTMPAEPVFNASGPIVPGPPLASASLATSEKRDWRNAALDRLGLAASVLFHLLLVLFVIGSLASDLKPAPEEAIPVTLVPDDVPDGQPAPAETKSLPPPSPPVTVQSDIKTQAPPKPRPPPAPPPPKKSAQETKPADAPPSSDKPDADLADADLADALASVGIVTDRRPTTLTQEELAALKAQAKRCWKIPAGWNDPVQISVTIRFRLNRDGTLKGKPAVVQFPASELGKTAAENAMRAVSQCGPFDLPADKYDQWRDVQLRFEP
jgi:hypothetical protein